MTDSICITDWLTPRKHCDDISLDCGKNRLYLPRSKEITALRATTNPAAWRIACRRFAAVGLAPGLDFVGRRKASASTLRVSPCRRTRKAAFAAHETPASRASRKERIVLDVQGVIVIQRCRRTARRAVPASRRQDGRSEWFRVFSCAAEAAFRVPARRRSPWAAGTSRHRRDSSVAHRAKEEVSSLVAASPSRIGNADPSPRRGSWSRVALAKARAMGIGHWEWQHWILATFGKAGRVIV